MDREFSEFANALLALRTGKPAGKSAYPSISFSADDQCDNDSTVFEEDDMFRSNKMVPFPSLSWASRDFATTYGLVDHATPTKGKKRVHSVSLSATSSESNDSNDVGNMRVKKTAVADTTGSNADKKTTLARGRYRCSLCGAFKTNHVCALVADKLMCSVSTQSLQANDLVSSMLLSNQKELRVQCRETAGIAAMAVAAPSSCSVAPTAAATATAASTVSEGPPRTFQERIVTVTRNRKTIQGPEPVVAVGQVFVNTSTSEASSDGSSVLTLRQPLPETSGAMALGATAHGGSGSVGANPVTPTATYAFPTHLPPYAAHAQPIGAVLPGGYLYGNIVMHSSLLGVPLQATTLAPTAVPSFPQVHHPRQNLASLKTAPNLIYPSALDLLGQAIYE